MGIRNAEHMENVILDELEDGEKTCPQLVPILSRNKDTVRKVLNVLEAKGLVESKNYGGTYVYWLARTKKAA